MKVTQIKLDKILNNNAFRFTPPDISFTLKNSISALGVINPVYLISRGEKFQILAGFKRFNCALSLKHQTIPARVVTPEEIEQVFPGLLGEHLSTRTLNIMEKSRIIQILKQLKVPWEKLEKNYLKIIDVAPQRIVLEQLLQLLELPREVQYYLEEYNLSLKQTEVFRKFNREINGRFIKIAKQLNIRIVELEKLMILFEDIAGKESVSVKSIFADLEVDSILTNENLSRNQKIKQISQNLEQRRYSKLKGWNDQLESLRKMLEMPDFLQISWDTSLERTGLTLQAQIKSRQDVENLSVFFLREETRKNLRKMLEIV